MSANDPRPLASDLRAEQIWRKLIEIAAKQDEILSKLDELQGQKVVKVTKKGAEIQEKIREALKTLPSGFPFYATNVAQMINESNADVGQQLHKMVDLGETLYHKEPGKTGYFTKAKGH